MRAFAMVLSKYRPLGRRRDAVSRIERLERSLSMELATPGYCTFTATLWLDSLRVALWTWPIEAAAMGFSSNDENNSRQSAPRLLARTALR